MGYVVHWLRLLHRMNVKVMSYVKLLIVAINMTSPNQLNLTEAASELVLTTLC